MRWKVTIQTGAILLAALALALATNTFASKQRKLLLFAYYPNALRVPARAATPPPVTPKASTAAPAVAVPAVAPPVPEPMPAPAVAPPVTATATPQVASKAEAKPKPIDSTAKFQPHPDKAYVEIGGDDVAALHRAGVLFLDARRTSVFEEGHIAGARPFSVWESDIDEKVTALFNERSDPREQDRPIVIYCSGGACEDSHMLAQKLWGIQFNNVYVYKDGYPDWQARGGAVRKGAQP